MRFSKFLRRLCICIMHPVVGFGYISAVVPEGSKPVGRMLPAADGNKR